MIILCTLLIYAFYFVGDYTVLGVPLLPIFSVATFLTLNKINNVSLSTNNYWFLIMTLIYLVVYTLGNLSAAFEFTDHFFHFNIPLLVLSVLAITRFPVTRNTTLIANIVFFYFTLTTIIGFDPSPFGPNIEYRIIAFLFLLSGSQRHLWNFVKYVSYFFVSIYGYSRGGMITYLMIMWTRSKRLQIFTLIAVPIVLITVIYYSLEIRFSFFGLRAVFFDLKNGSEATRIDLYGEALKNILDLDIQKLFLGDPSHIYSTFYTHNVYFDLFLLYGIVPGLIVIIGVIRFIASTWHQIANANSGLLVSYFYAVLIGSLVSGGMHENWIILVVGLLSLDRTFLSNFRKL
mgnify:CR=1 FL=1|tara:strand:- start:9446 stop:10483 length:1038 start_codon:yes stop_codon:yes gene_type:complete